MGNSKRRINIYFSFPDGYSDEGQDRFIKKFELSLALNGIKAYGFSDARKCSSNFDYEMLNKGADTYLLGSCDMVINLDYHSAKLSAVNRKANEAGIPVFYLGNDADDSHDFTACVRLCRQMLKHEDNYTIIL